jgi:hypothetical protein
MKNFLSFIMISLFFVFSSYKSYPEIAAVDAENKASLQWSDSVTSIQFRLETSSQSEMVRIRENATMNPEGNMLTHDAHSFYNNGDPVFLHSGEIHYFRTPEDQWEDLIIKAKNGGLNCIASYVYWGIHEPKDNNFPSQFWELEDLGNHRFRIKNRQNGLYLSESSGEVLLEDYLARNRQVWIARQSDECYYELRNAKSRNILEANPEGLKAASDGSQGVTATISSYSFELSLQKFTFTTTPGDFVRPTFYSFLMEKLIRLE